MKFSVWRPPLQQRMQDARQERLAGEFDKTTGNADELPVPLIVMIKFRGSVSDVQAALEAAKAKAEQLAGVVNEYEIARPTEDTEKMLKISAFDKGTPHKINKEEIEEI